MEQKVLLAMLAAGVAPVVAYAQTVADKLTGEVKELAKDESKTQTLYLVAGTYTITVTNNLTAQLSSDGETFSDEITIDKATMVTVKVTNTNEGEDKLDGVFTVSYKLSEVQKSQVGLLKSRIVSAINKTSTGAGTEDLADLNDTASELYAKVNSVEQDWAQYQAFVDGSLGTEVTELENDITAAASNYECYTNAKNGLVTLLASLENVWTAKETGYATSKCESTYNEIKNTITDHQAKVETAYNDKKAGTDYSETKWGELKSSIEAKITTLAGAIEKADANDKAYKTVAALIAAQKEARTQAMTAIINEFSGDAVYEDWSKEALSEISNSYNTIVVVETSNGTEDDHDNAAANQTTNKGKLEQLDFQGIVTKWQEKHKEQKDAYDAAIGTTVKGLQDNLDKANVNGLPQSVVQQIEAAQGAIDKLKEKIDDYNKKHEIAGEAAQKDIEETATKVGEKISAVNTEAAKYIANNAANTRNEEKINDLSTKLDEAKAAVAKLKSQDEKYAAAQYAGTATGLATAILELKTAAQKAYDEVKAGTWETANAGNITDVEGNIVKYQNDAEASLTIYDEVVAAVAQYDEAYTKLEAKVTIPDVTTGKTTYGAEKTRLAKAIKDIKDALAAALGKKDAEHTKAMAAIQLNAQITTDCNNLVASYDKDKEAYDKEAEATAIKALQATADKRINAVEAQLEGLEWKDKDGNSLVGNATKDIEAAVEGYEGKLNKLKDDREKATEIGFLTTLNSNLSNLSDELGEFDATVIEPAKAKVKANKNAKAEIDPLYAAVDKELNGDGKEYKALKSINTDSSRDAEFGATSDLVKGYEAELANIDNTIKMHIALRSCPARWNLTRWAITQKPRRSWTTRC